MHAVLSLHNVVHVHVLLDGLAVTAAPRWVRTCSHSNAPEYTAAAEPKMPAHSGRSVKGTMLRRKAVRTRVATVLFRSLTPAADVLLKSANTVSTSISVSSALSAWNICQGRCCTCFRCE